MHKEGEEIHIDDTEASGGRKTGHMRWVLGIGLLLAIIAMSIAWIIPALSQGDVEEEATMSGEYRSTVGAEQSGDDTDSIVSDEVETMDAPAPVESGGPAVAETE